MWRGSTYEYGMRCLWFQETLRFRQLQWCCSGHECDVFVMIFMDILALTGRMGCFNQSNIRTLRDKCLANILRGRMRNFPVALLPWLPPSRTDRIYPSWMCCVVAHYSCYLLFGIPQLGYLSVLYWLLSCLLGHVYLFTMVYNLCASGSTLVELYPYCQLC